LKDYSLDISVLYVHLYSIHVLSCAYMCLVIQLHEEPKELLEL